MSKAGTVLPFIINKNDCLFIDSKYALSKIDKIADFHIRIHLDQMLVQIDISSKIPYFAGERPRS